MKPAIRNTAKFTGLAILVVALSLGGGALGARLTRPRYPDSSPAGTAVSASNTISTGQDSAVSRSFEQQFRDVAAKVLPVVVEVNVMNTVTQPVVSSPFDFFFGNPGQDEPRQREFMQQGLGSGVIVARDGNTVYGLINNHVAGEGDEIEIVLNDERSYSAELVGADSLMDLALVSFKTDEEVPIATLGDSDSLEVGDWVFAVGNPLGFQSTFTAGVISAKARIAEPGSGMAGVTPYIQTDAAINQGNSGGALVNLSGEVVGINTWIASRNGGNIGLGFSIPVNNAKRAIADFIETGSVSYSWLGVQTGIPGANLAEDLNISDTEGAFVFGVYEDSPAGKAGIQPGDLITKINDIDIADSGELVRTVASTEVGRQSTFSVIRNGGTLTLTVKTERRDDSSGSDMSKLWPGITIAPISSELRDQLRLNRNAKGVAIIAVNPESVAGSGGLQQGDLITAVNGTQVQNGSDFYRAMNANTDEVQFRIVRNGRTLSFGFEKP